MTLALSSARLSPRRSQPGEHVSLAGAPARPSIYAYPSPDLHLLDDALDDHSYLIRVNGDPLKLVADLIVATIMEHYDVTASVEGEPA